MNRFSFEEYIRGYDAEGNEALWVVTNGVVSSMTLIDINNDGKNEVVAGCDNGVIQIYQNDTLLFELFENSNVVKISTIGKCFISVRKRFRISLIPFCRKDQPFCVHSLGRNDRSV